MRKNIMGVSHPL